MRCQFLITTLFVASAVVCIGLTGCRGHCLLPPAGPLWLQQARAVIHDPFPQTDIAPGDHGIRPPSYQNPIPEPVRNRIVPDAMPWLGR